jgi:hypothetical protein
MLRWARARIVEPVAAAVRAGMSAEALARAVVIGELSGVFPLPGATSVVCLALTLALRANVVVAQAVNLALTPVEIALLPVFASAGAAWLPVADEDRAGWPHRRGAACVGGVLRHRGRAAVRASPRDPAASARPPGIRLLVFVLFIGTSVSSISRTHIVI